ncbi:MAG: polysaccharide pyruvyl transferase family protein [Bacteroidales bacterium]|nr:polysaccharide pyruvyl transferase family protein [Bacteroidales bacterium]
MALALAISCGISHTGKHEAAPKYKNILLRDFRTVKDGEVVCYNIGTSAHAPGTLAMLRKHLPGDVRFTIWADAPLEPGLERMMRRAYPDIGFVYGNSAEADSAIKASDLLLVASGSGIPKTVANSLEKYKAASGKPTAAFGIGGGREDLIEAMDFVYFRDSGALRRFSGRKPPVRGWVPDAVFDFDIMDERGADSLLSALGLTEGRFVCCIPGQRHTPRWEYFGTKVNRKNLAENTVFEEQDNAILREIICRIVTDYGLKVLICPEQIPEMRLCKEVIYDRLPSSVRSECAVLPKFWMPDLALATYCRSRLVFGIEMHSQVMAAGSGIPAVVFCRDADGSKPDIFRNVGLGDWVVNIDRSDALEKGLRTINSILNSPETSARQLNEARRRIDSSAFAAVRESLSF